MNFTKDELALIIELANKAQVVGLESMNSVLSLAMKCQALIAKLDAPQEEPNGRAETSV